MHREVHARGSPDTCTRHAGWRPVCSFWRRWKVLRSAQYGLASFPSAGATLILTQPGLGASYGKEIWYLYERGNMTPEVKLTCHFKGRNTEADLGSIMREISDAREDSMRRKRAREGE